MRRDHDPPLLADAHTEQTFVHASDHVALPDVRVEGAVPGVAGKETHEVPQQRPRGRSRRGEAAGTRRPGPLEGGEPRTLGTQPRHAPLDTEREAEASTSWMGHILNEWDAATGNNHGNGATSVSWTGRLQPRQVNEKSSKISPYQQRRMCPRTMSPVSKGENSCTCGTWICGLPEKCICTESHLPLQSPGGLDGFPLLQCPLPRPPSGEDLGFSNANGRRPKHSARWRHPASV